MKKPSFETTLVIAGTIGAILLGVGVFDITHAERERVTAKVITTYTVDGSFLSNGTAWTIFELEDGRRIKRRGIASVPGETVTITLRKNR